MQTNHYAHTISELILLLESLNSSQTIAKRLPLLLLLFVFL